jgi:4-amino-4-deoxy-L-arabinose transferase-like glycosyltransferase
VKKLKLWLIPSLIVIFYLITHLYRLTLLPVFADEAIYVRWTQLIIDDWQQYLFFPMNDGKTPLLMWLMVPFQFLFSDQLFASRFVTVLIGLGQILSLGYLTKLLGGKKQTTWLAMILGSILPFWFFHHRMALTDALLGLGITLTAIGVVQIVNHRQKKLWIGLTALFFGLSLWSKLPAVIIIPSLLIYPWLKPTKFNLKLKQAIHISIAVVGGLVLFFSLRLHPVFPQIFSRGSDFLYPWQEVILQGKWKDTIINIPNYISYFVAYLTWPVLLLNLLGQFLPNTKKRRVQHILVGSAVLFAGPIALLGKVVYARYFFPVSIFLTISAALMLQELFDKKIFQKISGLILILCIGIASGRFIYFSLTDTAQTPFVSSDQEQYLYEWSSGHGIKESVGYIKTQAQNQTVAVATEGSFGTLPDGILMYFHRQNVDNIYVEGVGFPVRGVTEKFEEKAVDFDQILLVVNSHRLEIELPSENLLQEYCRPDNAPCLQIWDITKLLKENK